MYCLAAKGIFKAYGNRWILQDLDLELEAGQVVHLRGDNGTGKTTLLRILAGSLAPSSGTIEIHGRELGPDPFQGRQHLSYVPEHVSPSPWLSVMEYLHFRAALRNTKAPQELLDDWDLAGLTGRPMGTLSNGERRRVVLAASMLGKSDILLLDEPTVGLDERHRGLLATLLGRFASGGGLVLVASHVERQGLPTFDKVLTLQNGRLVNNAG